ncbi:MAG: hypothetical protein KDC00_03065, partial [Flavobacteriales bacterium]|nr:hypothetical protein [Flavobacteriales bacterium]
MIASMQHEERRDRNIGMIITVVFHVLLAILFLFIGLTTWDPPIPEESVEIAMADYGTTDDGGGDTPKPDPGQQQATPVPTEADPEDVATEDASDVEVVKPKDPKPKPKPKPDPKPE